QTLHRLSLIPPEPPLTEATEQVGEAKEAELPARTTAPGPLDALEDQVLGRHVKVVFRCWVILFGLVGAQMGWVLRPFVGDPGRPFVWIRGRDSNFFEAVWGTLVNLFT